MELDHVTKCLSLHTTTCTKPYTMQIDRHPEYYSIGDVEIFLLGVWLVQGSLTLNSFLSQSGNNLWYGNRAVVLLSTINQPSLCSGSTICGIISFLTNVGHIYF